MVRFRHGESDRRKHKQQQNSGDPRRTDHCSSLKSTALEGASPQAHNLRCLTCLTQPSPLLRDLQGLGPEPDPGCSWLLVGSQLLQGYAMIHGDQPAMLSMSMALTISNANAMFCLMMCISSSPGRRPSHERTGHQCDVWETMIFMNKPWNFKARGCRTSFADPIELEI